MARDRSVCGATGALLASLIHERLGLAYEPERLPSVAERLMPLLEQRGLASLLDYYYLLKYDPTAEGEWRRVSDALAVPETYFWREIDALEAIVQWLVPAWVAANPGRTLRCWSSACASGEEPLTLAMLLTEAGWFGRVPIEIVGSDASPAAIERARRGQYGARSFRSLPPALRDRYFRPVASGYQIDPALHSRVRWQVANMMWPGEVAALADAPIILCRNLFIYLSPTAITHIVAYLWTTMPAPGYLVLGAAESLLRIPSRFVLEEIGGAFVYVKPATNGRRDGP